MKKLIIICQIVVIGFFIIKVAFLTEAVQGSSFSTFFSLDHYGQAIAETSTSTATGATIKDVTDDGLQKERTLLALLQEKRKELDARESILKSEETKILALKAEVVEKVDALKLLENQLSSKLDMENTDNMKRLKELAKVYESSPPQKAAAMIDKLDIKTAAGITINMKRDRAGLIWGYLNPQKAVEITNEITRTTR